MKFEEAVEIMEKGKQCICDYSNYRYRLSNGILEFLNKTQGKWERTTLDFNTMNAAMWDIVEEKEMEESVEGLPLDQKARQLRFTNDFGYSVGDVKKAMTKLFKEADSDNWKDKSIEIFGAKLC